MTFVVNRVSEDHQKSSSRQWRHVLTNLNCADDATSRATREVADK